MGIVEQLGYTHYLLYYYTSHYLFNPMFLINCELKQLHRHIFRLEGEAFFIWSKTLENAI